MKKFISLLLLVSVIILTFSACSKGMPKEDYFITTDESYSNGSYGSDFAEPEYKPQSNNIQLNDLSNRKIIKTANISFQTKEYDIFMESLYTTVNENGGYIESSNIYGGGITSSRYSRSADITIRVPADNYNSFINTVGTLGSMTNKTEYSSDVTLQYVDIESRIKALETEYAALMELLENANSIEVVIELRQRISEVQYEIESYKSSIRKYDDLISYCTVTVSVSEVKYEVISEDKQTFGERISSGLTETFGSIGESLENFSVWFIVNIPYIIIWALVIIVIIVIIKAVSKSSKKKKELKNAEQYIKQIENKK